MMTHNNKGWTQESTRHSLARKGIKTGRKKTSFSKKLKQIGKQLKLSYGSSPTAQVYQKLLQDKDSFAYLMRMTKRGMDYAKVTGDKSGLEYYTDDYKAFKKKYDKTMKLIDEFQEGRKVA